MSAEKSLQTSEPTPIPSTAPTSDEGKLKIKRHGITITKRHGRQDEKWTCRIRFRGKVHWLTLAETAKESFDLAVRARREIHNGRWAELKAAVALRQPAQTTLGEVFDVYRQYEGHDRPALTTREQNIHAISAIVRETLGEQVTVRDVSVLRVNAELLWQWKETKRKQAGEAEDDERKLQILRSANSRMRQARSIFSDNEDLRTFYRHNHVELPDSVASFCKEPGFADCSKDEYHAPPDAIIAATFQALETLGKSTNPEDLNMFKAIWLAVGFGLRKSEIAVARNGWFININGSIYCRGDVLAKNKKFPQVRAQLGAWSRLQPLIEGQDSNAYVLAGTLTDRQENCFRRISDWMRGLGWQTTHHIHEFRAWAGCQIAMAPGGRGLLDAQTFLRHASFATTEKYYGHHLKIHLDEVQLNLPAPVSKTFTPVVLPTPESQTA